MTYTNDHRHGKIKEKQQSGERMRYVEGINRSQREMLPPSLEERIPANHAIRVIDAFADGLDMETLHFQYTEPAQTGRMPYDPRDLLKLYLYGYVNRVRSSRR